MDNSSTHTTPAIHARQLAHPRFHFHFTPTSSSWLNLVELTRTLNWVTSGQTGRLPAPSRCLHGAGDVGDVETLAESRPMIASHGFGRELLVGLAGTRGLGGGVQAISAVVAWIAV